MHRLLKSTLTGTKNAHEGSKSSLCTAKDSEKSTGRQRLPLKKTGKTPTSQRIRTRFSTKILEMSLDTQSGPILCGKDHKMSMETMDSPCMKSLDPPTFCRDN